MKTKTKNTIGLIICIFTLYLIIFIFLLLGSHGNVVGSLIFLGVFSLLGLLLWLGIYLMDS